MTAVSNARTITTDTNVINSEFISLALAKAVEPPVLYQDLVGVVDLAGRGTRVYVEPILARLTAASAVTETDEDTSAAPSYAQAPMTCARKSKSQFVSDQSAGANIHGAYNVSIMQVVDACRRAMNEDVLGLADDITSPIGDATTPFDMANYDTVLAAYRAKAKNIGAAALVLHNDAVRDLLLDLRTNGGAMLGTTWGGAVAQSMSNNVTRQGYVGMIDNGVPIFSSEDLPVGDTTGWTNMIVSIDPTVGYGIKMALAARPVWAPGVVINGPVAIEVERVANRGGAWVVASADYAVGIIDQNKCLGCISQT